MQDLFRFCGTRQGLCFQLAEDLIRSNKKVRYHSYSKGLELRYTSGQSWFDHIASIDRTLCFSQVKQSMDLIDEDYHLAFLCLC